MASLNDVARATEELQALSGRLHAEVGEGKGDFTRLVVLADAVGEKGDVLAAAFHEVDRLLGQLVNGDEPIASPASAPAAGAGEETEEPHEDEEVVSELRAIMRRLEELERRLEARAPDQRTQEAEPMRVAGSDRSTETNGSGKAEEAARPLRVSEDPGNGSRQYDGVTRAELYNWAQDADVPGRSRMSKEQLIEALRRTQPEVPQRR